MSEYIDEFEGSDSDAPLSEEKSSAADADADAQTSERPTIQADDVFSEEGVEALYYLGQAYEESATYVDDAGKAELDNETAGMETAVPPDDVRAMIAKQLPPDERAKYLAAREVGSLKVKDVPPSINYRDVSPEEAARIERVFKGSSRERIELSKEETDAILLDLMKEDTRTLVETHPQFKDLKALTQRFEKMGVGMDPYYSAINSFSKEIQVDVGIDDYLAILKMIIFRLASTLYRALGGEGSESRIEYLLFVMNISKKIEGSDENLESLNEIICICSDVEETALTGHFYDTLINSDGWKKFVDIDAIDTSGQP